MDDEFYDQDGHDDGQQFADSEEEAHFHAVISEFLELLDIYSPQFVLLTMNQLIQERSEGTLSSVN
tara:strand:- start:332 stop:529 length:198 start_codon:yes stop_codon:yes gene_type:complete